MKVKKGRGANKQSKIERTNQYLLKEKKNKPIKIHLGRIEKKQG